MNTEHFSEDDEVIYNNENNFNILHIYNKKNVYHLTKQVLIDLLLIQNKYCFFYQILSLPIEDFNKKYSSFSFLIQRNNFEADLYMNVETKPFNYIIEYIQSGKINFEKIYLESNNNIEEIIDLATLLVMPSYVQKIRDIKTKKIEKIEEKLNKILPIYIKIFNYLKNEILEKKLYNIQNEDNFIDIMKNYILNDVKYSDIILKNDFNYLLFFELYQIYDKLLIKNNEDDKNLISEFLELLKKK